MGAVESSVQGRKTAFHGAELRFSALKSQILGAQFGIGRLESSFRGLEFTLKARELWFDGLEFAFGGAPDAHRLGNVRSPDRLQGVKAVQYSTSLHD